MTSEAYGSHASDAGGKRGNGKSISTAMPSKKMRKLKDNNGFLWIELFFMSLEN